MAMIPYDDYHMEVLRIAAVRIRDIDRSINWVLMTTVEESWQQRVPIVDAAQRAVDETLWYATGGSDVCH